MIAVFEKASKIVKALNLGWKNKRFGLPVEREIASGAGAVIVRFTQPLDFDLADGFTDPFGRPWLRGS